MAKTSIYAKTLIVAKTHIDVKTQIVVMCFYPSKPSLMWFLIAPHFRESKSLDAEKPTIVAKYNLMPLFHFRESKSSKDTNSLYVPQ